MILRLQSYSLEFCLIKNASVNPNLLLQSYLRISATETMDCQNCTAFKLENDDIFQIIDQIKVKGVPL